MNDFINGFYVLGQVIGDDHAYTDRIGWLQYERDAIALMDSLTPKLSDGQKETAFVICQKTGKEVATKFLKKEQE